MTRVAPARWPPRDLERDDGLGQVEHRPRSREPVFASTETSRIAEGLTKDWLTEPINRDSR